MEYRRVEVRHMQQVATLGSELGAPVGQDVVGLGGETDDELPGAKPVVRDSCSRTRLPP